MVINKQTKQMIRQYLVKGLAWSIPLILTIYLASVVFNLADKILGPLTRVLLNLLPDFLLVGPIAGGESPFLSFVLLVLLMTVFGAFVSWRFGERIVRALESVIVLVPGVGFVYRNVRKMAEFFDGSKSTPFERVVMVPYPHRDVYTKAFVAGKTVVKWDGKTEETFLKVVIPNPPTGIQGIILVPERLVIDLPMSVEEGIQFYISLGMVSPATLELKSPPRE